MKFSGHFLLLVAASSWLAADETARTPGSVAASAPPAAQSASPVLAAPGSTGAQPADLKLEGKVAQITPELARQLTSALPKYVPLAPSPKPAAVDPDVLELPKLTIHKPRPRLKLTDEAVMSTKAFNEKLAKENLGSFDRDFLNKFTLPFFGISAEERAREEYERKKREDLVQKVTDMAKVAEVVDPEQAKVLRDAISKP